MMEGLRQWLATSLGARLLAMLALLMTVSSLVFLIAFMWLYRAELAQERTFASQQISMLFQASLENAMVKRDLPGVRDILRRLGRQPAVHGVMLANPKGEIRFASHSRLLKKPVVKRELEACNGACSGKWPPERPYSRFYEDPVLGTVLRTVKPIYNKPVCTPCHGPLDSHPVNGVLIADFDARNLRTSAVLGAAGMAGAGAVITLLTLLAAWYFLRRSVLLPVRALERTSSRLAAGDLSARAPVPGRDELGRLARGFNTMAEKVQGLVERLRAHDAFLQSLMDAVPDGIPAGGGRHLLLRFRSRTERAVPRQPRHLPAGGAETGAGRVEDQSAFRWRSSAHRWRIRRRESVWWWRRSVISPPRSPSRRNSAWPNWDSWPRAWLTRFTIRLRRYGSPPLSVTGKLLRLSMPPAKHMQVVDVAEVVEDIVSLLRFEAERQRVEVHLDVDHEHRLLATDTEMRMVVLNMVQNAFHAMPEGGELRISTRKTEEGIRLIIADTGVGMDAQTMEHIFEPFFSRRADRAEGTGLGLTICRAIVERYEGKIEVRSAPGRGTTFIITLPAAGTAGADEAEEAAGGEGGS